MRTYEGCRDLHQSPSVERPRAVSVYFQTCNNVFQKSDIISDRTLSKLFGSAWSQRSWSRGSPERNRNESLRGRSHCPPHCSRSIRRATAVHLGHNHLSSRNGGWSRHLLS